MRKHLDTYRWWVDPALGRTPEPSSEDRVLTARLRQADDLIGITILDHIILGDDRTFSFADQGWPE